MESLIQTINKLQDVFAVVGEHKIDLPQIVVVGSQSSGKSSVLESLVGKSFLPRGTGIVTRAPLILQMIRYNSEHYESFLEVTRRQDIKEWAIFLHKPTTIFTNFDDVRFEIERQTNFLAGDNKGITHEPIVLKVYTLLYDLTFVDLPGITKVPVGDQPEDIDEQIQKLILKYVEMSNSIILAVVTANTDPSTSESLKIARNMDPEGERTIAVVTKLDLIDEGTLQDTADFLCGLKIPVKLGIVGVVNRSQKDINENKSMKNTLQSEREFLKKNYPEIYKKHGNKVLANKLQTILIQHIKKTYPVLKKSLMTKKEQLENELKTLEEPDSKMSFILGLLKDIAKSYTDIIKGNQKNISDTKIVGGAIIMEIINSQYVEKLNKIDALHDLSDEQIGIILLNTAGTSKSSFINEKALNVMIGKQLEYLISPSLECVDLVCVEMLRIFDSIDQHILDILKRFPRIHADVKNMFKNILNQTVCSIKEFIKSYIETYKSCLNTTNPDFILELVKTVPKVKNYLNENDDDDDDNDNKNKTTEQFLKLMISGVNDLDETLQSSKQVEIHQNLTSCYFKFIRKNVRDFVPKRIQHKMVELILNDLDSNLIKYVFTPYATSQAIEEALMEDEGVAEDRKRAKLLLDAVMKALNNMIDIECY